MKLQSTNLLHKESDLKCTKTKAEHKIKIKKIKDNKIIQVKTGGFCTTMLFILHIIVSCKLGLLHFIYGGLDNNYVN